MEFLTLVSYGQFEVRALLADCSNYKLFIQPREQQQLTRQERTDMLAIALEVHAAFRNRAQVPGVEIRFRDDLNEVRATVECFGDRREYIPGLVLEEACLAITRPWPDLGGIHMMKFLQEALPMFLLGFQDYAGRATVLLLPAVLVSRDDARLLKSVEVIKFQGRGVRMQIEPVSDDLAQCIERYCRIMEQPDRELSSGTSRVLRTQEPEPGWWQRALELTRAKNVVDRACITLVEDLNL
jgi:hypothetical protein